MTTLSPSDQEALDALVEARFDLDALPPRHRERAERLMTLMTLLDHLPDQPACEELTARTLHRVQQFRQPDALAAHPAPPPAGAPTGPPLRLRDLVALAAITLIAVSVLWPMLASTRHTAQRIACQANLADAGRGLTAYAAAHDGKMPRTRARPGNDHWWLTGQFDDEGHAQSNSAHLFVLVRSGFAALEELACPENPFARHTMSSADMKDWNHCRECSYSYQNQYTERPLRLQDGPLTAVLADKNPFFDRGKYHRELQQDTNSRNHTDSGQNVLMTDGRVSWLTEPRLNNRDNIYHVGLNGRDRYTGRETPTGADDSFLVP